MYREILRKVIPILAVIVALTIVGFGIYSEFSPKDLATQPKLSSIPTHIPTTYVENKPTFTVQRGNVTRDINLTGQITSATKQQLSFRAGGPIDKILVKKNDQVKSGQLLANLYLSKIQFTLKLAQINLDIDKLNLAVAQHNLNRSIRISNPSTWLSSKNKSIWPSWIYRILKRPSLTCKLSHPWMVPLLQST